MAQVRKRTPIHTFVECALFIAAGSVIWLAGDRLDLSPIATMLAVIVLVVVVAFGYPLLVGAVQSHRERVDSEATCDPILWKFDEDKDDEALLESYKQWRAQKHSPNVRLQFLQAVSRRLEDEGHIAEARKVLSDTDDLILNEAQFSDLTSYTSDFEARVKERLESEGLDENGENRRQRRRHRK